MDVPMKRVKSRIYSTTELDKKRIAIFSTQDLDEHITRSNWLRYEC